MQYYGKDRDWPFSEGSGTTLGLVTALLVATVAFWRSRPNFLTRLFVSITAPVWLLILYFFRDPNRSVDDEPGVVVSAGDGTVVDVAREREQNFLQRDVIRISIFLSIVDVHVQRIPLHGTVTEVKHRPGKFLQAFRPEASTSNEHIAMVIETDYGPILVKQIAGILARRCVNHAQPGDSVQKGQRFGLIKFGSRVDLFLPTSAEILVTVGTKVYGGITPMARLSDGV